MKQPVLTADDSGRGDELRNLLALPDIRDFARAVLAWIDRDGTLVYSVVRRGTSLVGGQRPDIWTDQDAYANARICLYRVIDDLRTGDGTVDMRRGVGAYLVQWAAPLLVRAMETDLPAGLTAAYRRRTKLRAAQADLTVTTGAVATLEQAADHANRRGSIDRGLRPVARARTLARVSDLPGHRRAAAADRAALAGDVLGGTDPARLTDDRRVELVVDYNRVIIRRYGFDDAITGQMLARVTDLLPERDPGADAQRAAESDALAAALQERAAGDLTAVDAAQLVEDHNRATIIDHGLQALRMSGSVVSPADDLVTTVQPVDMAQAADYARPLASTSGAHQIVAPGENSMLIAALLSEAGKAHPGLERLVVEMLDAYRAGEDLRATRALAARLGMSVTCLAGAIESIRRTMRDIVAAFL